MELWPTSELSSSASSTGEGGNGGNSITSTLTCSDFAIQTSDRWCALEMKRDILVFGELGLLALSYSMYHE